MVIGGLLNFFPASRRVPEILDMYPEKVPFKITVLASLAPNVDLDRGLCGLDTVPVWTSHTHPCGWGGGGGGGGGARKVWRHGTLLFPAPSRYPALREEYGHVSDSWAQGPRAVQVDIGGRGR